MVKVVNTDDRSQRLGLEEYDFMAKCFFTILHISTQLLKNIALGSIIIIIIINIIFIHLC